MGEFGSWTRAAHSVRRRLEDEVKRAGFTDIGQPDVGAKSDIIFMTAIKSE